VIEGEGMPRHQALGYGNLFIEFAVVFPMEVSGPFRAGQLFLMCFHRFHEHSPRLLVLFL
jgi:DnaJ-class molecular chaperone